MWLDGQELTGSLPGLAEGQRSLLTLPTRLAHCSGHLDGRAIERTKLDFQDLRVEPVSLCSIVFL